MDDNPTNRYVLRTTLSRAGHTVVEAEDGTGALALLKDAEDLPEVAVVDVRLPDMTGFEVCERIKADPATAALPVLHVSASAITVDDRTQGLNRGADAYLTEPIAPDELLATVTATLRYARARRRAERLADRLLHLNEATLLLYSADSAAGVARAAARGAAIVLGAPAVASIISPHGEPASAAGGGAGGQASSDNVADVRLDARDLPPYHEFGDRTGTRLVTVHAREWPGFPQGFAPRDRIAVAVARQARPAAGVPRGPRGGGLDPDDEQLLAQLAQACALALEALRSYTESTTWR